MSLQISFDDLWNKEPTIPLCPFAESFSKWAEELVGRTLHMPSVVAINQAKILLLDKYFEWRSYVPRKHRVIVGQQSGHICIFQIFEQNYERLKLVELSLTPPMLFIPAPPPEPPAEP